MSTGCRPTSQAAGHSKCDDHRHWDLDVHPGTVGKWDSIGPSGGCPPPPPPGLTSPRGCLVEEAVPILVQLGGILVVHQTCCKLPNNHGVPIAKPRKGTMQRDAHNCSRGMHWGGDPFNRRCGQTTNRLTPIHGQMMPADLFWGTEPSSLFPSIASSRLQHAGRVNRGRALRANSVYVGLIVSTH